MDRYYLTCPRNILTIGRSRPGARLILPDLLQDRLAKLTEHSAHVDMVIGAARNRCQLVLIGARAQDPGMRRAPRTVAIVSGVIATSCTAIGVAADATNGELSIEETQARLTSQVVRESQVAAGDLRMIEATPQTWPDFSLGCPGRRRTLGTSPVPGYRFVLDAGGERRTYHADTRGRIVRCDAPSKPLDPIAR